jgi:hypothetical protein
MFSVLLMLHSIVRWLVVAAVTARFGLAAHGLATDREWGKPDRAVGGAAIGALHTQVVLGIALAAFSPTVHAAFADLGAAMADPNLRFYSVEHGPLMLIGAIGATVAQVAARKADGDANKHRIAAIGFGIALALLILGVPWPFRAVIGRPWL